MDFYSVLGDAASNQSARFEEKIHYSLTNWTIMTPGAGCEVRCVQAYEYGSVFIVTYIVTQMVVWNSVSVMV